MQGCCSRDQCCNAVASFTRKLPTLCMQRVIIYPAYIDVKKTVAQGRRIAKSKGRSRFRFSACLLQPIFCILKTEA